MFGPFVVRGGADRQGFLYSKRVEDAEGMVSWKDFRKAFRQAMIGPAGPGLSPEVETFDIGQNIAEGDNDAA